MASKKLANSSHPVISTSATADLKQEADEKCDGIVINGVVIECDVDIDVGSDLSSCEMTVLAEDSDAGTYVNNDDGEWTDYAAGPVCWTAEQAFDFHSDNPWLLFNDRKLKCSICAEVKSLNMAGGSHLSKEWVEGTIKPRGERRKQQMKSLRNKIYRHRNSDAHKSAVEQVLNRRTEQGDELTTVKEELLEQPTPSTQTTGVDLSDVDVHQIAPVVNLVRLSHRRLSMNNNNNNRVARGEKVTDHIATEMRRNMVRVLKETKPRMSIIVDEIDAINDDQQTPTMIIYLRSNFIGDHNQTMFFDLVEVQPDASAAGVQKSLLSCLKSHGVNITLLSDILVGLASDGASAMLGRKSGVATLLRTTFPDIVVWYSSAHRLQQAVGDAVDAVAGIDHFRTFVEELRCSYRPLASLDGLNAVFSSVGRIFDAKWLASSERTVKAVWNVYASLHDHLQKNCASANSKERSTFEDLAESLSSNEFVQNLAILYDSLSDLSDLSLNLQCKDMTLPKAHNLIARHVVLFKARKAQPGERSREVNEALKEGAFKGVQLHPGKKCNDVIDQAQFYQNLADNMRARLLTTVVDGRNTDDLRAYVDLLTDLRVLDPTTWPDEEDVLHGETNVIRLARRFRLVQRTCVQGFRDFKDNGGKVFPVGLQSLIKAVNCITFTTSEDCERGLTVLNAILKPERARLSMPRLSCLLLVHVNGDVPEQRFNFDPACQVPLRKKPKFDDEMLAFWSV